MVEKTPRAKTKIDRVVRPFAYDYVLNPVNQYGNDPLELGA